MKNRSLQAAVLILALGAFFPIQSFSQVSQGVSHGILREVSPSGLEMSFQDCELDQNLQILPQTCNYLGPQKFYKISELKSQRSKEKWGALGLGVGYLVVGTASVGVMTIATEMGGTLASITSWINFPAIVTGASTYALLDKSMVTRDIAVGAGFVVGIITQSAAYAAAGTLAKKVSLVHQIRQARSLREGYLAPGLLLVDNEKTVKALEEVLNKLN